MEGRQVINDVLDSAKKVIFGQDQLLESIISGLVCKGHILVEGMPGLGKTMSISVISRLCQLGFKRVQFTPDLLPSDLIGTLIYNQAKDEFSVKFGPIFTQILLADEINRSPAKVQSALLEAMAERQVTIGDKTHQLDDPFIVLATQNPIEQEGTYPLPEAQLDRFMVKVLVDYPNFASERKILDLKISSIENLEPLINKEQLQVIAQEIDSIYVDDKLKDYIIRLVHATRPCSEYFKKEYDGAILAGVSPRAALWLLKLGRFYAYLGGKDYVSPEEIIKVAPMVLGHRLLLSYEAQIDQISTHQISEKLAQDVI